MNVYQYNNITVKIKWNPSIADDVSSEPINALGFCQYSYPEDVYEAFKESEYYMACENLEEGRDNNPDIFISFLHWYDNYGPDQNIIVEVEAEHPFWVYHDLFHVKNLDVIGCEGNITAHVERDRLKDGLELWQQETDGQMEFEYRGFVKEAFWNRFKEQIQIPFFQYWEEDMYELWSEEEEEEEEEEIYN